MPFKLRTRTISLPIRSDDKLFSISVISSNSSPLKHTTDNETKSNNASSKLETSSINDIKTCLSSSLPNNKDDTERSLFFNASNNNKANLFKKEATKIETTAHADLNLARLKEKALKLKDSSVSHSSITSSKGSKLILSSNKSLNDSVQLDSIKPTLNINKSVDENINEIEEDSEVSYSSSPSCLNSLILNENGSISELNNRTNLKFNGNLKNHSYRLKKLTNILLYLRLNLNNTNDSYCKHSDMINYNTKKYNTENGNCSSIQAKNVSSLNEIEPAEHKMTLFNKIELNNEPLSDILTQNANNSSANHVLSSKFKLNSNGNAHEDEYESADIFSISLENNKNADLHINEYKPVEMNKTHAKLNGSPKETTLAKRMETNLNKFKPITPVNYSNSKLYARCYSEPPNTKLPVQLTDNGNAINKQNLIQKSPTIRLLFKNINNYNETSSVVNSNYVLSVSTLSILNKLKSSTNDSNASKNLKISIDDLGNIFSCRQLAYKRSFSYTKLKFEQKLVKKSPSFDKFLKNVLKGKQKSNSLFNFNSAKPLPKCCDQIGENKLSFDLDSVKSECSLSNKEPGGDSGESDSLDQIMMMIMNNKNLPVLKIDDSLRNSLVDLDLNDDELLAKKKELIETQNKLYNETLANLKEIQTNLSSPEPKNKTSEKTTTNESYIPDSVKNALESAGINIEHIINMTNKLEMSIKEIELLDDTKNKNNQAPLLSIEEPKHSNLSLELSNAPVFNVDLMSKVAAFSPHTIENQITSLIDNMKSFEVKNSRLNLDQEVDASKDEAYSLRTVQVKQNLSAKVSEQVENASKNETMQLKSSESGAKPVRKKSIANMRYNTVSNFTLPNLITPNLNESSQMSTSAELVNKKCLPFSVSWNSEVGNSYNSVNSAGSGNNLSAKILPPKVVSQFKPVLNVHRRTPTTPVPSLTQLMTSASIDSFLNPTDTELGSKETLEIKRIGELKKESSSKTSEENIECDESDTFPENYNEANVSTVDLSKTLPGRAKKKATVTRSISYNTGQSIGVVNSSSLDKNEEAGLKSNSQIQNKVSLENTQAQNKSIDLGKINKSSLASINDIASSSDGAKTLGIKKGNMASLSQSFLLQENTKNLSSVSSKSSDSVAGTINTATANSTLAVNSLNHGKLNEKIPSVKKKFSNVGSMTTSLIPSLTSNGDLQITSSSMLALASKDSEHKSETQHVSRVFVFCLNCKL